MSSTTSTITAAASRCVALSPRVLSMILLLYILSLPLICIGIHIVHALRSLRILHIHCLLCGCLCCGRSILSPPHRPRPFLLLCSCTHRKSPLPRKHFVV